MNVIHYIASSFSNWLMLKYKRDAFMKKIMITLIMMLLVGCSVQKPLNYEEFKKNGFKVNKLGDYDLTLDFDKKPE